MDNTQEYSNSQPEEDEKRKGIADIVFLLDATGSMGPCIEAVKNSIERFIDALTMPDANQGIKLKDWRISVCTYRDYTYDPKYGVAAFEKMPFSRDREEIHNYISSIEAKGGGPEAAESLLDALFEVISMGSVKKGETSNPDMWRYRSDAARCIIIFTDAPYREVMTTWAGATFNDIVSIIQQERFRITLFAPEMDCYDELESLNRCVYESIELNGKTPVDALREFVQDSTKFDRTMEALGKTITQTAQVDTPEML